MMTRNISEFDSQARSVLERILGRSLSGAESVQIEVVQSPSPVRPPRPRPPVTGVPVGGEYAGRLVVPDDFDEPLEELSEYVE